MDEINKLLLSIECIDGTHSNRQERMFQLVLTIRTKLIAQTHEIEQLTEAAERYRELADQRLLNHLNIDQEHIINICNETLQEVATDELSPMALFVDTGWEVPTIQPTIEPLSIPPIPVTEIDFQ